MKLLFTVLMIFINIYTYANNINISFFDKNLNHNINFKNIPQIIFQSLEQRHKLQDIANIKIIPIYDKNNSTIIDYYFILLASNKNYSFSVNKIFIKNNKIDEIIENYIFTKQDLKTISAKYNEYVPQCPDEKVDFVIASEAYNDNYLYNSSVKPVIDDVYKLALNHNFKTIELLDKKATVNAYLDYLSCKNLKGFFSIGHGLPDSIMLADGLLDYTLVDKHLKDKLSGVALLLNSCCVHGGDNSACIRNDHPLKDSLINIAKVQKFIGGYNPLEIIPSENTSKCFWHRAFDGAPLNDALDICGFYSPLDTFHIDGIGKNYLVFP